MDLSKYSKLELIAQLSVANQKVMQLEGTLKDIHPSDTTTVSRDLREKIDILQAFHEINQLILSNATLDEILGSFAQKVVQIGFFRSLTTAVVQKEINSITILSGWMPFGEGENQPVHTQRDLDGSDILADVVRSGQLEVIEGWDEKRFDKTAIEAHDLDSYRDKISYFIPMKDGDEVVGVLATGSTKAAKAETLRKIEILAPFLDQFALGLRVANLNKRTASQAEIFKSIFDNIPVLICFFDNQGRMQLLNSCFETTLGWTQEEVLLHPNIMEEFYPDAAYRQHVMDFIQKGTKKWGGFKTRTKDGRALNMSWSNALLQDGTSIGIGQDLTHSQRLEQALNQSQKMEVVGRLAGGVAHDFNNILTVILGSCQFLLADNALNTTQRDDIELIHESGVRASSLTNQLLTFSRRHPTEPQVLDLNSTVDNLAKTISRLIPENIHLSSILAPTIQKVKIDPNQLEQVVLNLVVNAKDAMHDGGQLTIETATVTMDEESTQYHLDIEPGTYVLLAISDTGIGISPDVQSHIFEPFYTTKKRGEGTGLGLSTVYGIVKQAQGNISVYSELGQGTTFKIYLPAVEAPIPSQIQGNSDLVSGTGETILVVEDDPSVRRQIGRMLKVLGYQVLVAPNSTEALNMANEHRTTLSLLLTDVVMPDMNGKELAEKIQALLPQLKILYMSGYTDNVIVHHGILDGGIAFIAKPFAMDTLAIKIQETLNA